MDAPMPWRTHAVHPVPRRELRVTNNKELFHCFLAAKDGGYGAGAGLGRVGDEEGEGPGWVQVGKESFRGAGLGEYGAGKVEVMRFGLWITNHHVLCVCHSISAVSGTSVSFPAGQQLAALTLATPQLLHRTTATVCVTHGCHT